MVTKLIHILNLISLILTGKVCSEKFFHGFPAELTRLKGQSCPVTARYSSLSPLRNTYPLDLFKESSNDSYPCYFQTSTLHKDVHQCSHQKLLCPIEEDFFSILLGRFEGASAQICKTFEALERAEKPVSLFVFGGSVTGGGLAGGCFEGECKDIDESIQVLPSCPCHCGWQTGVVSFLSRRFPSSTINHYQFNVGATDTCSAVEILLGQIENQILRRQEQQKPPETFVIKPQDIILYDYSVNDGASYATRKLINELSHCLRRFLRKVVELTEGHAMPTVVLLESYPFHAKNQNRRGIGYTSAYREVANQLRLPILSYYDLHWSGTFDSSLAKYPKWSGIVHYKWARQDSWVDVHPPWPVQDLYADLIAASLDRVEKVCKQPSAIEERDGNFTQQVSKLLAEGMEECPISEECETIFSQFADLSAPLLTAEEVARLPYEWTLYQDRKDKAGWIIQGNETVESRPMLNFSFHYDFIINHPAALLEISYMRTYANAGAFKIFLCGKIVKSPPPDSTSIIDTLVSSHFTSMKVLRILLKFNRYCSSPEMSLQIQHVVLPSHVEERVHHKVKIHSIRLESRPSYSEPSSQPIRHLWLLRSSLNDGLSMRSVIGISVVAAVMVVGSYIIYVKRVVLSPQ